MAMSSLAFGQSNLVQDRKLFPKPDQFTIYQHGNDEDSTRYIQYVNSGDTLFTAVYRTYPYMWLYATINDTASSDTISLEIQFWQGTTTDTTDMMLVKTLTWNDQTGSVASADSITAAGNWWCNVGATAYTGLPYFCLKVIGKATNKILDGVQAIIEAWGENR